VKKFKQFCTNLRQNYWGALFFDVAAILVIFVLIHSWQSRHLLPGGDEVLAPDFLLIGLDQERYQLSDYRDSKTIVYFFSPTCHICNVSMPNLQKLYETGEGDDVQVLAVALDYVSKNSVVEFTERHEFTFPVLLGTNREAANYRIRGFPTYYVINATGKVEQRSVGYSTLIGLKFRS
jgi:peroxiredoxin